MADKEINPKKVGWTWGIVGLFAPTFIIFLMALVDDRDLGRIFNSSEHLLGFLELSVVSGLFCGYGFGAVAWLNKRKRKLEEKDEINELMRQYLERKLKEEQGEDE